MAKASTVRVKQKSHPWFQSEVLEAIIARDKAMSKYKLSGDPADFSMFKSCRNEAQRVVKEAKRTYFSEQINENTDKPQPFLKDSADLIAPVIAHIINLSLEQGTVSDDMKYSKVILLFKKGIRSNPRNYRPVSILSVTSTVLEKVVHEQLYEYAVDSRLLYEFQSGFRKSHLTDSSTLLTSPEGKSTLANYVP